MIFKIILLSTLLLNSSNELAKQYNTIETIQTYITKNYRQRKVDFNNEKTIFLYGKGTRVGCIHYTITPKCTINYLQSPEPGQHKGIGLWLVSQALIELKKNNCSSVTVYAKANSTEFYLKLGFQEDYCLSNGLVAMSRSLNGL